jgi:hypothetical protein
MQEDDVDPIMAQSAMIQIAAKIGFDAACQEKLSAEEGFDRFLAGCRAAYNAAAGGTLFKSEDLPPPGPGKRRTRGGNLLSVCSGVGRGARSGFQQRMKEKNRQRNKAARKTRRSQRK